MDATMWIGFIVVSALMWWASYYATAQMRIKKNEAREQRARELQAEREAQQATSDQQIAKEETTA